MAKPHVPNATQSTNLATLNANIASAQATLVAAQASVVSAQKALFAAMASKAALESFYYGTGNYPGAIDVGSAEVQ